MPMSPVPQSLSPDEFAQLRRFLLEANYTEDGLQEAIGTTIPPHEIFRNMPRLLHLTRRLDPLCVLIRLFFLGVPVAEEVVRDTLPPGAADLLFKAELMKPADDGLARCFQLVPFVRTLIVSDKIPKNRAAPDIVLGISPAALRLLHFTIREDVGSAMDLGAGNGIQSLLLAMHAKSVTATDLNPRALALTDFNAQLNGIENIECLRGNTFQPVEGRTFDLIVSNPPFFLTPSSEFMFSDNDLELDEFCRRLFRGAPACLNEGGFFHALFEWVEVKGQTWEERLQEWFSGIGCDVWVLHNYSDSPEVYAEHKLLDTLTESHAEDQNLYKEWISFYKEKQIVKMHGGYVVMRKRSGNTWLALDEIPLSLTKSFGDKILSGFLCRDFLAAHPDDDQLLEVPFAASEDARLTQDLKLTEGEWKLESLRLGLANGLKKPLGVDGKVATLVEMCDGKRTLREVIEGIASKLNISFSEAAPECLRAARFLVEGRYLTPVNETAETNP